MSWLVFCIWAHAYRLCVISVGTLIDDIFWVFPASADIKYPLPPKTSAFLDVRVDVLTTCTSHAVPQFKQCSWAPGFVVVLEISHGNCVSPVLFIIITVVLTEWLHGNSHISSHIPRLKRHKSPQSCNTYLDPHPSCAKTFPGTVHMKVVKACNRTL